VIIVKAGAEGGADAALAQVDGLLMRRRPVEDAQFRPRSLGSALRQQPDAAWVLVSVPGRYAAGVAREALELGRSVFLYSDNVSLANEVSLKQFARERGLLLMGPDCGTAIINGIGLGFANRVRRGAIGLVGASGTGLQAITSRIHELGAGVSQAIGTGGRDLHSEVGGITALQALDLLGRDPETRVIVLVSKPPDPGVATAILEAARRAGKPVVIDFIGHPSPARHLGNLHFSANLSEAAEIAVEQLFATSVQGDPIPKPLAGFLRGLFSGGTLAYEAMLGLQAIISPLYSNAPITEDQFLTDAFHSRAHTILDLGADEFTVGRLHPMIDNELRLRRLRQEAVDPEVGLILLDVVLGEGAHPDPAGELAPAIREVLHSRAGLEVEVIVIGTDEDPQDLRAQIEQLSAAGAGVSRSVTEALEHLNTRLGAGTPEAFRGVDLGTFTGPFAAVNVGLESFHDSLVAQGARALQVDWRPPAGGDERLAGLLAKMKNGTLT
jgi:FdrA protein